MATQLGKRTQEAQDYTHNCFDVIQQQGLSEVLIRQDVANQDSMYSCSIPNRSCAIGGAPADLASVGAFQQHLTGQNTTQDFASDVPL